MGKHWTKQVMAWGLLAVLSWGMSGCQNSGNDDDDDVTLPITETTPSVPSGPVTLRETTLTCTSSCGLQAGLTPETLTVASFQGKWTASLGTVLEFTGFGESGGTFQFTDPQGVKGEGSFLVQNGVLTFNISSGNSQINLLTQGLHHMAIQSVTEKEVKLALVEVPTAPPVVIDFTCAQSACNTAPAATPQTATAAQFVGSWATSVNGITLTFNVTAEGTFKFLVAGTESGQGTFQVQNGNVKITFTESKIPEIAVGPIAFTIQSVSASKFSLELIQGSADLPLTSQILHLSCVAMEFTAESVKSKCGRSGAVVTPGNATTADFVGEWLTSDRSAIAFSLSVTTAGSFQIADTAGKTALGTYSVQNAILTLNVETSQASAFPKGSRTFPIATLTQQEFVLNLP